MNSLPKKLRGVVLVELVLIVPLLVFMVFGITELGRALYQQDKLTMAIQAGARYLSRTYEGLDFENGCIELAAWAAAVPKVTNLVVYGNAEGVGSPLLPGMDGDAVSISDDHSPLPDPSGNGYFDDVCVIRMSAAVAYQPLFLDYIIGDALTLSTAVEQRWIGE